MTHNEPNRVEHCNGFTNGAPVAAAKPIEMTEVFSDGEVVILACRPSILFVLLVSWPALVAAVILLASLLGAEKYLHVTPPHRQLCILLLAGGAILRLMAASFQWMGRMYVLTNRRVLRVRGVMRPLIHQAPLRKIHGTTLVASKGERLLGLGTLLFHMETADSQIAWTNLARPQAVQEIVETTLRQAR